MFLHAGESACLFDTHVLFSLRVHYSDQFRLCEPRLALSLKTFLLHTRYCIKCTFRSDFVLFAALFSFPVLLVIFVGFIFRPA